jgi:hypothetical protein
LLHPMLLLLLLLLLRLPQRLLSCRLQCGWGVLPVCVCVCARVRVCVCVCTCVRKFWRHVLRVYAVECRSKVSYSGTFRLRRSSLLSTVSVSISLSTC